MRFIRGCRSALRSHGVLHEVFRWASCSKTAPLRRAYFQLPSIIDPKGFCDLVQSATRALIADRVAFEVGGNPTGSPGVESRSPRNTVSASAPSAAATRAITESYKELLALQPSDVEAFVRQRYDLTSNRHTTRLVPYAAQVELLRCLLPPADAAVVAAELAEEEHIRLENVKRKQAREEAKKANTCTDQHPGNLPAAPPKLLPLPANRVMQWYEADVYVKIKPMTHGAHWRPPIVCVMGHIDHGKTTLLDTLQGSNLVATEPGLITQCVRAFTAKYPTRLPNPSSSGGGGGKEKEKGRGKEAAGGCEEELDQRYPTSLTFVDTPGHKVFAEMRLHGQFATDFVLLLIALDEQVQRQTVEVVKIALACNRPIIVAFNKLDLFTDRKLQDDAVAACVAQLRELGLRLKEVRSAAEVHSLSTQSLPKAKAVSLRKVGLSTPGSNPQVLKREQGQPARGDAQLVGLDRWLYSNAVKVEKSLDDDMMAQAEGEGDAAGSELQQDKPRSLDDVSMMRRGLSVRISAKLGVNVELLVQLLKAACRLHPLTCDAAAPCQATILESWKLASDGRGTRLLPQMLTIVRNGELRVGLPVIADSAFGKVVTLRDYFGAPLRVARPGTAAIATLGEPTGCPGSGTHIIEQPSTALAAAIGCYRRLLSLFVECYPTKLDLLRPKGLDTRFLHIGNFGQTELSKDDSIEVTLLHGREAGMNTGAAETVNDEEWSALQPHRPPATREEYEAHLRGCSVIGVLLKVSTWHTGRLLARELGRLGTRNVHFELLGVRFGVLTTEEVEAFRSSAKLIICFQTPPLTDGQLAFSIEQQKMTVLETDVYTNLISFVKNFAVQMQRQHDDLQTAPAGAQQQQQQQNRADHRGATGGPGAQSCSTTLSVLEAHGFKPKLTRRSRTGLTNDAKHTTKQGMSKPPPSII